jgi:putative colanic acid biosynthesis UDP-glucose lipid carrier transferase
MHNQKKFRKYLKNGGDILILIVSFLTGAYLAKRHAGMASGFMRLGALEIYLLFFFCLAWNFGARIFGLYDEFYNRSLRIEMIALGENILLQVFVVVAILFAAKSQTLSRFFVFTYYILLLVLLTLWKTFLGLFFSWLHKKGRNLSHILIIGSGSVARSFADTVTANHHLGFRLKGFVADEPHPGMGELYIGKIGRLASVLEHEKIDEVIIAFPYTAIEEIGAVIAICENYPTQVRIIPEYFKFMNVRFRISRFGAFPLFSIRANPLEQMHVRLLKRFFDLLFTLLLFIFVFSWLWPLLALLIKLTSPGPVFFKQERWGIKNARIICYKFRSMVRESRDVDANGHYQQASRDDPRVTRLGRFLRHSNLDELPQFFNVLKGDMSVVGPRPHPTPMNLEAKDSIRHYQLRHLVKPGITGWAQVNGLRGETGDEEMLRKRVEADIWYIENWSFSLDLRIIWLSIWLMLKGDPEAY